MLRNILKNCASQILGRPLFVQRYSQTTNNTRSFTNAILENPYTGPALFGMMMAGACCFAHEENKKLEIWEKVVKNSKNLTGIRNRDCVVYFEATADHNGALICTRPQTIFADLSNQTGVTAVYRKVKWAGEITDTLNTLNKQNNRIHSIIIAAHGTPSQMLLSEPSSTDDLLTPESTITSESRSFQKTVKNLHHKPCIILISCSTGNDESGPSLARQLSKHIPESPVIAPTRNAYLGDLSFKVANASKSQVEISPTVIFRDWKGENITATFKNNSKV